MSFAAKEGTKPRRDSTCPGAHACIRRQFYGCLLPVPQVDVQGHTCRASIACTVLPSPPCDDALLENLRRTTGAMPTWTRGGAVCCDPTIIAASAPRHETTASDLPVRQHHAPAPAAAPAYPRSVMRRSVQRTRPPQRRSSARYASAYSPCTRSADAPRAAPPREVARARAASPRAARSSSSASLSTRSSSRARPSTSGAEWQSAKPRSAPSASRSSTRVAERELRR